MVADIVDSCRSRAGFWCRPIPRPCRISRRRVIECPDDPLDDVVHISEIAFHPALVKDFDRFALQDGLGKDEEGHVRASPRPIDGKKSKTCAGELIEMRIA